MSLKDANKVRITTTIVVEGTSFLDNRVVVRSFGHDYHANSKLLELLKAI